MTNGNEKRSESFLGRGNACNNRMTRKLGLSPREQLFFADLVEKKCQKSKNRPSNFYVTKTVRINGKKKAPYPQALPV